MEGVNNAFCMSKEQYELARLATKCAGLQLKIDDQVAEIIKLKALCTQLKEALEEAMYANSTEVSIDKSGAALEAWRSEK